MEQESRLRQARAQTEEIVDLEVEPDHKNGGKMFRPQHFKADPQANGEPTMRFYINPEVQKLQFGRKLRGRIKCVRDTGKKNRKGAKILMAEVELTSSI